VGSFGGMRPVWSVGLRVSRASLEQRPVAVLLSSFAYGRFPAVGVTRPRLATFLTCLRDSVWGRIPSV
jgi:hypothetical protein